MKNCFCISLRRLCDAWSSLFSDQVFKFSDIKYSRPAAGGVTIKSTVPLCSLWLEWVTQPPEAILNLILPLCFQPITRDKLFHFLLIGGKYFIRVLHTVFCSGGCVAFDLFYTADTEEFKDIISKNLKKVYGVETKEAGILAPYEGAYDIRRRQYDAHRASRLSIPGHALRACDLGRGPGYVL